MKPKLLHIALGSHNTDMYKAFENHFETTHYDWTRFKPDKINHDIITIFNQIKPDFVFMQIQDEGIIYPQVAFEMKKNGAYIMNWTGDVRSPIPQWFIDLAPAINTTLFSNMTDVELMRMMGLQSDFWQVGFDPEIYSPYGEISSCPAIVFMGSNYLNKANFPLSKFRYEVVDRLKNTFGDNFGVYGSCWESLCKSSKYLNSQEESLYYRSCKIAINLSHFDYSRYSSDRMFRIMGSGAFCLSHHYQDLDIDFKIGTHLDTWTDIDELISKIHFYLKNTSKRNRIAQQGCRKVRKEYCWDNRVKELKKMIYG